MRTALWLLVLMGMTLPVVGFGAEETVEITLSAESENQVLIRNVFTQLSRLVKFSPEPGRGYFIEADYTVMDKGKLAAKGAVSLMRGSGHQFKLISRAEKLPVRIGTVIIGYDRAPWLVTNAGSVYRGLLEPKGAGVEDYFEPKIKLYSAMASQMFDMAAMGMLEPLKQWCSVTVEKMDGDRRRIDVLIDNRDHLYIDLKPGTATPEKLTCKTRKIDVEIVFKNWSLDAPADPQLFAPEAAENAKEVMVPETELNRIIAAAVNFLMEGVGK